MCSRIHHRVQSSPMNFFAIEIFLILMQWGCLGGNELTGWSLPRIQPSFVFVVFQTHPKTSNWLSIRAATSARVRSSPIHSSRTLRLAVDYLMWCIRLPTNQFRTKNSCEQTCSCAFSWKFLKVLIMADNKSVEKVDWSVLPQLESWEKMMKLPLCEAAWNQSVGVYDKVRGESKVQKPRALSTRIAENERRNRSMTNCRVQRFRDVTFSSIE